MIKSISLVQTTDRNINQLQQGIKQALDPLLSNPISGGYIISNVALVSGTNSIPHALGAPLQGWFTVLQNAAASLYDQQSTNTTPAKTLLLVSDASVTVSLYVF